MSIIPSPYEYSIPPGIMFEIKIAYQKFHEAVISIEGWLRSNDGKILAKAVEASPSGQPKSSEIGARGSIRDKNFKEEVYTSTLIARLEKKALNYIENRRIQNKKRDIFFTLDLNVRSIETRAEISHLHQTDPRPYLTKPLIVTKRSGAKDTGSLLAYAYDPEFFPSLTNLWVISGSGSQVFLSINQQSLKKEGIRIPSTDWIHDYAPKLELGEYFIVEIAKGKMTIKKAWEYVEKAEECYRQWDTKGAYANCREVGKLLSEVIKKRFRKSPMIKKWKRAIEKFEKLTSLDLHEEDIKEEVPKGEISISKADTEHILIVTKALIKYAEELLQEKRSIP
ncbi:hypothetical protein KAU92_00475 [Candidatus Bathyarchaeota archaeon]|nr:hypothetical protein [Candidatus Bathyarchaeota archaeon]